MKIASSQVNMSNDYRSEWAAARITQEVEKPKPGQAGSTNVELSDQAMAQIRQQARNGQDIGGQNPNQNQGGTLRTQILAATGSESLSVSKTIEGVSDANGSRVDVTEMAHYDKSITVMKMILERMSGKAIDLYDANEISQRAINAQGNADPNGEAVGFIPGQTPISGMGVQGNGAQGEGEERFIRVTQYNYEKQSNFLEFSGSIERENGDNINFSMAVGFSQQYERLSTEVVNAEQLKDPLIISFSTKPVALSDEKMSFDIDADGQDDQIAQLQQGFGFLALDKNGDNQINDGSELFGALSGNGFADLAQYDQDQNGYIDENDDIFDQLSVWVKNEDEDKLVSLKEAGIGAIATENVDSPMNIRDSQGDERLGVIQKSGYYLNEDGKAGLIQQMDFVVWSIWAY